MTYKKRKKSHYRVHSRNYVDSDYKEKVPLGVDGKPVESLRLSEEEKEFVYRFENGYYGNNHRKEEIFTEYEGYDENLKKELDDQTNARERDIFTKNKVSTIREDDISFYVADNFNSELKQYLVINGIEKTITDLIDSTAYSVQFFHEDIAEIKEQLRTLSIHVVKALNLEKKYRKKQRRKK